MFRWRWSLLWDYRAELASALAATARLNLVVLAAGLAVGLTLCTLRLSPFRAMRYAAATLIEVVRGLPALVLMVWVFFCLPILSRDLLGVRWSWSSWWTAVGVLALGTGAYLAEIFRAGLSSVPQGEIEAAVVCGLSRRTILARIVVLHTLKAVLPPAANLVASTIKLSAIASFIAVPELLYTANLLITQTSRPLEFYTFVAAGYLALILPASLLARWTEAHFGGEGLS